MMVDGFRYRVIRHALCKRKAMVHAEVVVLSLIGRSA